MKKPKKLSLTQHREIFIKEKWEEENIYEGIRAFLKRENIEGKMYVGRGKKICGDMEGYEKVIPIIIKVSEKKNNPEIMCMDSEIDIYTETMNLQEIMTAQVKAKSLLSKIASYMPHA